MSYNKSYMLNSLFARSVFGIATFRVKNFLLLINLFYIKLIALIGKCHISKALVASSK